MVHWTKIVGKSKKNINFCFPFLQKFDSPKDPIISAMAAASDNLFKDYEKWLRVATLIDFGGRHLCHNVLHKKECLPTDGAKLYIEFKDLKSKICKFKDQEEILCPSNGVTDESKFDLTLYTSIIQVKFPNKYNSLLTDLRKSRNEEFHRGDKSLSDMEFNELWNNTKQMLESHGFDIKLIGKLKTCDLSTNQQFKDILNDIVFEGMTKKLFKNLEVAR